MPWTPPTLAGEGPVVRGDGRARLVWRRGPPDDACHDLGGLLVMREAPAPRALQTALQGLGNPQAPVALWLGLHTGVDEHGVHLGQRERLWADRTGRYDVLAALVDILAESAELGVPPSQQLVNDELAVRFDYDLLVVDLQPIEPAEERNTIPTTGP